MLKHYYHPEGSATPTGGSSSGGNTPKGKRGAKEWVKNKLKALANLLGKLAQKAGAALPGILGSYYIMDSK